MKNSLTISVLMIYLLCSCKHQNNIPSTDLINEMNLKRGSIISCNPGGLQLGTVPFEFNCSEASKQDFLLGLKLLHSFEYDEAEKAFTSVIEKEPSCAMAYWGIAMANFHPLWSPPTEAELEKGNRALDIATSLQKTRKENAYIDAISSFYKEWKTTDHYTRSLRYEKGMEKVYNENPQDKEAAIFYALALTAAADPMDKTFAKQKKAGALLQLLAPSQPDHPGILHYLIHTYDYPGLAHMGLPAARKYASIAPSSAHAMHMPSHIFTRLGYWDECIRSNIASVASAQCYAPAAGIKGHWDEELHGIDYLVYAYLQKGENDSVKKQLDYLNTIEEVYPLNFKVAYAFAAIPSRYVLENKLWSQAATLKSKEAFPWNDFPWQKSIIHFTRVLGAVNTNQLELAKQELQILKSLHNNLLTEKDHYKANQVAIQIKSGEAWILLKKGDKEQAINSMQEAADMEDQSEKHPVTPGEVIPARELLADMYMQTNAYQKALSSYEQTLNKCPNRFNALFGAARASEMTGNKEKAIYFHQQLQVIGGKTSARKELKESKQYLLSHNLIN